MRHARAWHPDSGGEAWSRGWDAGRRDGDRPDRQPDADHPDPEPDDRHPGRHPDGGHPDRDAGSDRGRDADHSGRGPDERRPDPEPGPEPDAARDARERRRRDCCRRAGPSDPASDRPGAERRSVPERQPAQPRDAPRRQEPAGPDAERRESDADPAAAVRQPRPEPRKLLREQGFHARPAWEPERAQPDGAHRDAVPTPRHWPPGRPARKRPEPWALPEPGLPGPERTDGARRDEVPRMRRGPASQPDAGPGRRAYRRPALRNRSPGCSSGRRTPAGDVRRVLPPSTTRTSQTRPAP